MFEKHYMHDIIKTSTRPFLKIMKFMLPLSEVQSYTVGPILENFLLYSTAGEKAMPDYGFHKAFNLNCKIHCTLRRVGARIVIKKCFSRYFVYFFCSLKMREIN